MRTLFTLCGWVVVGAVLAFAGQQAWNAFKEKQPERSKVIEEKVAETVKTGGEVLQETAKAVREEVADSKEVAQPTDGAQDSRVEKTKKSAEEQPIPETVGKTVKAVVENGSDAAEPVGREAAIEARFYNVATGNDETEAVVSETVVSRESAAEYEQRQNANRRKEEVLMQRQMRIVDELTFN